MPLKACLVVCSAGNLGSQEVGGFKMGGSSFRVCRHCLATDSDIQCKVHVNTCILFIMVVVQFLERCFMLRTAHSYSHHCDLIENIPEIANPYSTVF